MGAEQSTIGRDLVKQQPEAAIRLLLVGEEDAFQDAATRRFLSGDRVRLAGSSKTLLGGLAWLESEPVDLVLLSAEFREEELSLFALDAYRSGFAGLILHGAGSPERVFPMAPVYSHVTAGGLGAAGRRGTPPAAPALMATLTAKQRMVLSRVAEGWSNQEIARELSHSEGAVKAILQQLFNKFGVRKRAQLVRMTVTEVSSEGAAESRGVLEERGNTADSADSIQRANLPAPDSIQIGDFKFDLMRHQIWIRGCPVNLTPLEAKLLIFFARHPEELLSHDELLSELWVNHPAKRESLRVLIQSLRTKVETGTRPRYIVTQPYYGYRFVPAPRGRAFPGPGR